MDHHPMNGRARRRTKRRRHRMNDARVTGQDPDQVVRSVAVQHYGTAMATRVGHTTTVRQARPRKTCSPRGDLGQSSRPA